MAGRVLMGVVIVLASAAWAPAAMKTLVLKDGSTVTGDVSETAGGYLVKSKYGSREISRDDVAKVTDVMSFSEEYKQKLAGIDAKSADDHVKVGQWAYDRNQLSVAEKEVREALDIDKDHAKAKKLLELLTAGTGTGSVGPKEGTTGPDEPPAVKPGEIALAGPGDIQKIRLSELTSDENQLPIVFSNDVVKRFLKTPLGKEIADDAKALQRFQALTPAARAVRIRDAVAGTADAADILKDVAVKSDPRVIVRMREKVWTRVALRCGSRECHGGAKLNGVIRLVNRPDAGAAAAYTNFILLDGMVGKTGDRLIDRNEPERSLLLQYGLPNDLPPKDGQLRHAKVKGWLPLYKNTGDGAYQDVLRWISSLRKDRGDLSLDYTAPEGVKLDFGGSLEGVLQPAKPLGGSGGDTKDDGSDKVPETQPEPGPDTGAPAPPEKPADPGAASGAP
ncbi:MAG: hypothetical protein NTV86_01235 [Planctomycetota bacterium]|nr:hypothetical protein [Planctomycetota bacterium]